VIIICDTHIYDWQDSEMEDSTKIHVGELRNGAKTKAGPLEAERGDWRDSFTPL
jgi:hypothetical protein